jgi:hypothetical protein
MVDGAQAGSFVSIGRVVERTRLLPTEQTMMRARMLGHVVCCLMIGALASAQSVRLVTFDDDGIGRAPRGFLMAHTGPGKTGVWMVTKDVRSLERGNVLAQTDADPTDSRFPVCVLDDLSLKNLDLSVEFKPVSGRGDQAGGLVWRYQDANNYYLVRANALENNVVVYKVQNGQRTELPFEKAERTDGKKVNVPSGDWSRLRVTVNDALFVVYFNGEKLYEVKDTTFGEAGRVGVWTKADSVTYFDNLRIAQK